MLHVHKITSFDLPELQPYRTMRRQMEHRQQGIFVAEGEKVVRRLLESRFEVISALMPKQWFRELEPLLQSRVEDIAVFVAEKTLLETLTGFSMYQGLLALGRVPQETSLQVVLDTSPAPRLFAAVDGLSSAENMGVIVRNGAAFRMQALFVGETCSSPYLRRAVRSSMGAVFKLPIVEPPNLASLLQRLKSNGIRCVAAHPHAPDRRLSQCDMRADCCLVFGSEGYGLSAPVLAACDEAVSVPMPQGIDSLNVGSAAAVFLYEVNRQRGQC